MSEWIKCSERLPVADKPRHSWIESDEVLAYVKRDGAESFKALGYHDGRQWRLNGHNGNWDEHIKCWMPIPKVPDAE